MKSLKFNILMLYLLVAANYFFGFVTLPYFSRIFEPKLFGELGFAISFSLYCQLIFDFGFTVSETKFIAENVKFNTVLSKEFTSVILAKLLILIVLIATLSCFSICETFDGKFSNFTFYFLFVIYAFINSIIPDYIYRGIEQMKYITIRSILIKGVFAILVFSMVDNKSDITMVPIYYIFSALVALIFIFLDLKNRLCIWFVKISIGDLAAVIVRSSQYFVSRVATSLYRFFNTFAIGLLYPESRMFGQYIAALNLINAGTSACVPISDALYPYMIRTKNLKLMLVILFLGELFLIFLCFVANIFSEEICIIVFGEEYAHASRYVNILLVLIPVSYATYILGYPALGSVNKIQFANISVIIGGVIYLLSFFLMYVFNQISIENMCYTIILVELVVLGIRGGVFAVSISRKK